MSEVCFITLRLATGNRVENQADVRQLVDLGVTHVIDTWAEQDFSHLYRGTSIVCLRNGTLDDGAPKPVTWFQESLRFGLSALAQPHMRLYAHCASGVNRGPSTAYAVMRATGFEATLAEGLIRRARPQVELRYREDAERAIVALGYE